MQLDPPRQWRVIYGALDLRTGREIAVEASTTNRAITANFLIQLLLLFPNRPLAILWDRASWHRGGDVQQIVELSPTCLCSIFPPPVPTSIPRSMSGKRFAKPLRTIMRPSTWPVSVRRD